MIGRTFVVALFAAAGAAHGQQYATSVVDFDLGVGGVSGFDQVSSTLGTPERFTGELTSFPGVVSPFGPPFGSDELVSIGEGGFITLELGAPALNDPSNAFGVDLIVFTNSGFIDSAFPGGVVGDPPGQFGVDSANVEVSQDGTTFVSLGSVDFSLFPTMGYLDGGAFDATPGSVRSDFYQPVDPSLTLGDFAGQDLAGIRTLYAGSGGGTPIDIAASGLSEVNFIRFSVPDDGTSAVLNFELDAVTVVPAPGGSLVALAGLMIAAQRRRS